VFFAAETGPPYAPLNAFRTINSAAILGTDGSGCQVLIRSRAYLASAAVATWSTLLSMSVVLFTGRKPQDASPQTAECRRAIDGDTRLTFARE